MSDLPNGWRLGRLGDIAELFNGKAGGTGGTWLRAFKTRHVYDGYLRLTNPAFAPDDRAPGVPTATFLRAGDTLTPNMAHGTIGRVAFVRSAESNWTVDGQIMVVRPKDTSVIGRYIYDWMSRADSKRQLVNMEKGGAFDELRGQTHIYRNDVATIPILIPPIGEQMKIAATLSSVDDAIEATNAVIDQIQVVKKAMMAEMMALGLPGKHTSFKRTEIGRVPERWEIVTLGQITQGSAFGPRFPASQYRDSGNVGTVRTTDLTEDWEIDYTTIPKATLDPGVVQPHLLEDGDLLVSRSGTCGVVCIFRKQSIGMIPAAFLIRFRLHRGVNEEFVRIAMMVPSAQIRVQAMAAGGVQKNLSGTNLATLQLPWPSLDEQSEIVAAATALDARTRAERAALRQLKMAKSALMAVLLTGEVRVKFDEAD